MKTTEPAQRTVIFLTFRDLYLYPQEQWYDATLLDKPFEVFAIDAVGLESRSLRDVQ
jgi:hypothetical protein